MRLRRRELLRAGDDLGVGLGKPFVEARAGEAIEGRLVRRMDLASGRFALVEKSREFTLVPWKPGLERQLGKTIAGRRSEEHTSELQSLMRISYAVFCLKKKKETIK